MHSEINPYFYSTREIDSNLIKKKTQIEALNGTFWKYEVTIPQDVTALRQVDSNGNCIDYEADIPFVKRYVYNQRINLGSEQICKAYIDIESDNPATRWVDFNIDHIKCVSIVSDTEKIVIAISSDGARKGSTTIETARYIYVDNEQQLLQTFFQQTKNYGLLIGWNLRDFDQEMFKVRTALYGMQYQMSNYVWMDLMDLYKRFVNSYSHASMSVSFALDKVAQHEIGEGKLDKTAIFEDDIDKLMAYNLHDSVLCWKLDAKLKLTNLIDELSIDLNVLLDDCLYFGTIIERVVMRELNGKYIFKCKSKALHDSRVKGAFVHDAPTGIFNNVAVFDFASLYPNVLRTFNCGVDTIVGSVNEISDKQNYITSCNGFVYRKDKLSVYNALITQLLDKRKKYKNLYVQTKDEIYNTLQIGIKFLIAAFYGVLGSQTNRIHDQRIAETVTATGRWLQEILNAKYEVIYGDTDSVMIPLPEKYTAEQIKSLEIGMNNLIEHNIKQFNVTTNYLNIRFEKVFSKVYFYGTKKRYYGNIVLDEQFNQTDEIFARGLEIRRTDWCKAAISYETNLLKLLLNDIKAAKKFHEQFIEQLRSRPISEFVINKSLTKNINEYKNKPPHVRVAKQSDYIGSKIPYIVTQYKNKKIVEVKRYDDEDGDKIIPDYNYYLNKQILPLYQRLLLPLLGSQKLLFG